ncbi:glycosyltransferase [Clostridium ihumii]|uniref:glycosyltransferase n=1 Tax=Clostridium ihumii TaxID=1470356 RepID=UPI0005900077|nr:glycosyltransferase [Clostridium ihumii]
MKNILFISYYFEPLKEVGAKRVSYWAKYINEVDRSIICDVITATQDTDKINKESIRNIYYVPNNLSKRKTIIKDVGREWEQNLKRFFNKNELPKYDVVVITGGPFMQFNITKFIKTKMNCKVILDFRDPFANNPRFNNSIIKKKIKSYYEKMFISNCDKVITVNKYCTDLLTTKDYKKVSIIENGYDEKTLSKIDLKDNYLKNDKSITLVYAGKIHDIETTDKFLKVLTRNKNRNRFSFYYIGNDEKKLIKFSQFSNIHILGHKDYEETLKYIKNCDIGMVITSADPFISTTKVFDYIALNKNVFVLTDKNLTHGSLRDILSKYSTKCFWSCSDEENIEFMLNDISKYCEMNKDEVKSNNEEFSRKMGLLKLVDIINSM